MKKFINKLSKLVQITYLLTFVITSFLVTFYIESDVKLPLWLILSYSISTFLSLGKVIYVTHFLDK